MTTPPIKAPYVNLAAHNAAFKQRMLEAVGRVIDHGWFILGPEVAELERRIAAQLDVPHVVGVNTGTDALVLALRLRDIGPGDEVITTSHSFVATASAIRLVGATPVFVDVDERTMLIDPAAIEAAITPRTRAVMPVHLNGHPCEIDAIAELCRQRQLTLIEDCAQAYGARFRGRQVGAHDIGCFSLHPLKIFSACGDAGFIVVNSEAERDQLKLLRNLGLRDRDNCVVASPNPRMHTIQAAMLLVKLDAVDEFIAARQANAAAYREALAGLVTLPPEEEDHRVIYSAFVIRPPAGIERDRLVAALLERGVDAKVHYPLAIHQQPAFVGSARHPLPVTERVVSQIISLPVVGELLPEQRQAVIDGVRDAVAALRAEAAAR
ncbi:MAG: DegT/DnrJ/EryC1/StrS family aminotransferase [Myxococcales bacterium]|nr:DegT/DnrJ/EryC1/StrS family aminotransferase [Myxococcales bacterium]MCB9755117.1 DegT/DnrJ/EryC1/StrS family aminotransferase [Myxococcales bacterium]